MSLNVTKTTSPVTVCKTGECAPKCETIKSDARYSRLLPSDITMARDGGTMVLTGNLSRSEYVSIRLDGAITSPTRGTFFTTERVFPNGASEERPMTSSELAGVRDALVNAFASDPLVQQDPYLQQFRVMIEKTLNQGC